MKEILDFALGLISGLVVGIIVGYVVEHFRFGNELKIERIKRLTPHIELVHPIIERLHDDSGYLKKIQLRYDKSEYESLVKKISKGIEKYRLWYLQFQSNGFKPELAYINKSLYALINGLFVHSQMVEKYGENHILSEIDEIHKTARRCLSEIENFLTI